MQKTKPVVIISGASRGIGEAVAHYFAARNYHVILVARSAEKLAVLSEKLNEQYSAEVKYFPMDISNIEKVKSAYDMIEKEYGRVDVLFNSAGIVNFGASDIKPEEFDEMMGVNIKGSYNWIHHVVPIMKQQQSGYIFNVCSRSAIFPNPGTGAYALTKSGLLGYSYALLRELIKDNIKVTALCPGATDTPLLDEVKRDTILDKDHMVSTEDVVKIVDCLLSLSDGVSVPEMVFDDVKSPFLNVKKYQKS